MPATPLNRICYVEDDEDIQRIVRMTLERVGKMTVEVVGAPTLAIEAMTAFKPDMVMLDWMMPKMDGPTLFRDAQVTLLAERLPDLRLVPDQRIEYRGTLDHRGPVALGVLGVPPHARIRDRFAGHRHDRGLDLFGVDMAFDLDRRQPTADERLGQRHRVVEVVDHDDRDDGREADDVLDGQVRVACDGGHA